MPRWLRRFLIRVGVAVVTVGQAGGGIYARQRSTNESPAQHCMEVGADTNRYMLIWQRYRPRGSAGRERAARKAD